MGQRWTKCPTSFKTNLALPPASRRTRPTEISHGQPRLTRILTAPKSPVVGSAIDSCRLPRVHGECHRLDAGKHRPWAAARIQIESIAPAGKSNEQSGHRVPLPVDRAFNRSLRCSSLLPSFVGPVVGLKQQEILLGRERTYARIRVSSPSVRKVNFNFLLTSPSPVRMPRSLSAHGTSLFPNYRSGSSPS